MSLTVINGPGPEFANRLMKGISAVYGYDNIRTNVYIPSTNVGTERLHRTLNFMLGKVISESQRDWGTKILW